MHGQWNRRLRVEILDIYRTDPQVIASVEWSERDGVQFSVASSPDIRQMLEEGLYLCGRVWTPLDGRSFVERLPMAFYRSSAIAARIV